MNGKRLVVVTGLSGSGRSAALKAFEDIGYYCVDNLPLPLLSAYIEFSRQPDNARLSAIGLDIRERGFPKHFGPLYTEYKESGEAIELLFLDASDQTIVRRFSETRRPHPLARHETPLLDGIRAERRALGAIKKLADRVIDTSDYTIHDLRQTIERQYTEADCGRPMVITVITFGYKYGVPYDVDLMFDVRFLPNPHFVQRLRPLTGEHEDVRNYIMDSDESREFAERLLEFLAYLLPRYRSEGKSYLTIGFGCTGGRHRSVTVAMLASERLRMRGYEVHLKHRDIME